MKNVIEFKDVGLNFGGVKALDGISFEVKEGSLFQLLALMVQEKLPSLTVSMEYTGLLQEK